MDEMRTHHRCFCPPADARWIPRLRHEFVSGAVLLFVAVALLAAGPHAHAAPPPVSAREAIAIAEKDLADRGLDKKLYVVSVTLERASMLNSRAHWFVKWSESIPASNPRNREVGVKVNMDRTAVRLVKEPGAT